MSALFKSKTKRVIVAGTIIIFLTLGSLALLKVQSSNSTNIKATQVFTTTRVTRGDLTYEVSGTGKIVAPNTIDLIFSTTGKVAELNVTPGKTVVAGDELAKLDQITRLQMDVEKKKMLLALAEQALDDLEINKEITLANAVIAQSDAAAQLEIAQKKVVNSHSPRCEKDVTEHYYYDYMYARHDYLYWYNAFIKKNTGYGDMYIQERMAPYQLSMNLNYANWKYCEGFSELEIDQSSAAMDLAESNYQAASAYFEKLKNNYGIDPDDLAVAQLTRKNADLQLQEAQRILDGATITSPVDGTVLSVAAAIGETIDKDTYKSPYIKIANLNQPQVKAIFDETDLSAINTGCKVQATFSAIPNETFSGSIIQIDPSLVTADSITSAQVYINLDNSKSSEINYLPIGLNASIELNCPVVQNTLLVPVQAIKEENDEIAKVYVLNSDGTISPETVTTGARSTTLVAIEGNINAGDVVITSEIE